MKYSTDFFKPENQVPVLRRFWLCSILLFSYTVVEIAKGQVCESAAENRAVVVRHYNIWANRHKELVEKCYSDGSVKNEKSGKGVPYYSEMNHDGNIRHFVGSFNSDGDIVWKEADQNPNKQTGSDLKQDDPCRDEITASQREGDALAVIAGALDNIPCYVYIQMIFCDGSFEKETCTISFFEAYWQKPESKKREEQWKKEFYDKLKAMQAQAKSISSNLAKQGAISTGDFLQKRAPEEKAISSKSTNVNTAQDNDVVRREFAKNMNMAEIKGERVYGNRDDKIDHVKVENDDGTATTFYDNDWDGRLDWLAKERADGTTTLFMDTNNDGVPDERADIDPDGDRHYSSIQQGEPSIEPTTSLLESSTSSTRPTHLDEKTGTSVASQLDEVSDFLKDADFAVSILQNLEEFQDALRTPDKEPRPPSSTLNAIGEAVEKLENAVSLAATASRIVEAIHDPENDEKRLDVVKDLYNRGAELTGVAGASFGHYGSGIIDVHKDVYSSAVEQAASMLDPDKGYDPATALAPVAPIIDWLGKPMGIDKMGTRTIDYEHEKHLSWRDLRQQYGWIEGTKRAVWYHLIHDLRN